MTSIAQRLAALPDGSLQAYHQGAGTSVEDARLHGRPGIAEWVESLGRLMAAEITRRDGERDPQQIRRLTGALREATDALADDELTALGVGLLEQLEAMPVSPEGDFKAAQLELLGLVWEGRHGTRRLVYRRYGQADS